MVAVVYTPDNFKTEPAGAPAGVFNHSLPKMIDFVGSIQERSTPNDLPIEFVLDQAPFAAAIPNLNMRLHVPRKSRTISFWIVPAFLLGLCGILLGTSLAILHGLFGYAGVVGPAFVVLIVSSLLIGVSLSVAKKQLNA